MTKAEIANIIQERVGLSKSESAQIVDCILDTMREALVRGEDVKLSSFGNFVLRDKNMRRGRNPRTGEEIMITPRRVVTFKASQLLKQHLTGEAE